MQIAFGVEGGTKYSTLVKKKGEHSFPGEEHHVLPGGT